MVTDQQVRKLMKLIQSEETLTIAAAKSGMDEKTARKYRRLGQLPSQCQQVHSWKTRQDHFAEQFLGDGAHRHAGGGLAGAGAFQHVARVVEIVLEGAG